MRKDFSPPALLSSANSVEEVVVKKLRCLDGHLFDIESYQRHITDQPLSSKDVLFKAALATENLGDLKTKG